MTMCGTEKPDMTLVVQPELQTFGFDGLRRYNNHADLDDRYDACTYTIASLPPGLYPMGDIVITFTKIENVEILLNAGPSMDDASIAVVKEPKENASLTDADTGKVFEASVWNSLFVTVLPKENAESTSFEFTYQIVGTPVPGYFMEFYIKNFTGPDGFRTLVVFSACLFCLFMLFCACLCICICRCCRKGKEDEGKMNDKNKVQSIQPDMFSPKSQKQNVEMRLESIDSGRESDHR